MEFCPKCGSVLITKLKNSGCTRCGYTKKGQIKLETSEKMEKRNEIPVINKEIGSTAPIVNERCPECGHEKCYFWTIQTRSSDESETKFFKCVKCGHTKRNYD